MSKSNGEYSLTVAENISLRAEVQELRVRLGHAAVKFEKIYDEAMLSTHCLATIMHVSGLETIEFSDADKRECYEATWLRIRREIIKFEDKDIGPSIRLTLLPVTDKERKENEATLAAEKKPKIIRP